MIAPKKSSPKKKILKKMIAPKKVVPKKMLAPQKVIPTNKIDCAQKSSPKKENPE